jgi:hypothetical protein
LTTSVHEAEKLNLEQIQAFLKASEGIRFEGESRQPVYHWIEQVLRQQQYAQQGRAARGLLRRYLGKMPGRSRAQVTRLIARYRANGELQPIGYLGQFGVCQGRERGACFCHLRDHPVLLRFSHLVI